MNYPASLMVNHLLYFLINGVSIICCLLVFYAFCKLREPSNLALKLILVLTCFDFGVSTSRIFGAMLIVNEPTCQAVQFVRTFFERASLIWSFSMSFIAFLILKNFRRKLDKLFRNVLICSITAALMISSM